MNAQLPNRNYYRIMPGAKSKYAQLCHSQGFIGAHYGFKQNLTGQFPEDKWQFNKKYIPVYLANFPDKSKIAAGLACGMLWTICKGYRPGDIVLSPDGSGQYWVGEVQGEYYFEAGDILPHRRHVQWRSAPIARADMSPELQRSTNSIGTSCQISKYAAELDELMGLTTDEEIAPEQSGVFSLEKHLEDFLVHNWQQTELAKRYNIYEADGETGQQFKTETGNIDILAISKDRKELLVVELKKGRTSDQVVGQVQRYMGDIIAQYAEEGQTVRGAIIALEDSLRLRRALSVAPNIDFYRYEVSFQLKKE